MVEGTEHAKCRGENLIPLFFSVWEEEIEVAKKICVGCPCRPSCREHAIVNFEYGVWGGTDEDERRDIRRERAKKKSKKVAVA